MEYFIYLAATYDSGAYGACAYQEDCVTIPTTTTTTATGFGAPDTGFLNQPQLMIPLFFGLVVLSAAIFLVIKKVIRHVKRE